MKHIDIGNCIIGENHPVFLIAEAGVNHNGDIDLAHKLIDAAVEAGADAVKFQTFITEELVSPDTPAAGHHLANVGDTVSHFELIKKLELPFGSFQELKEHCEQNGVAFISTPYDIPSVELLAKLKSRIIKIASSEMTNYPLLDVVRESGIPVIISTGMSRWDEIFDSVRFVGERNDEICILKCTSNYPASLEGINLEGIRKLRESFPEYLVGFSDHTEGLEASLVSLGLGASVIERHFTLDKNAWGPDHKASMTPDEFKNFVKAIRTGEKALGSQDWGVQDEEKHQRATMQKGVYARRPLKRGERVSSSDLKFLRPRRGISPKDFFLHYKNNVLADNIDEGKALFPQNFVR